MINKQTTLDLNGPVLSFVQQPVSIAVTSPGSATFVGIATATFPTTATNTGSISYRWYDQNGPLSDGTNITGSGTTTLSLLNLQNPIDNNRNIYLKADYIPSAYGLPGVAVTVGSARSTGNAVNDTLDSTSAIITVYPNISITQQPVSSTVSQDTRTTFTVSAVLSDGTQTGLTYKWMLNDFDLTDSATISGSSTSTLTITSSVVSVSNIKVKISHPTAGNSPVFSNTVQYGVTPKDFVVNIETITNSSTSASLSSHNLTVNGDLTLLAQNYTDSSTILSLYAPDRDTPVEMDIYSGKGSDSGSYTGGQGGYSRIRFTMKQNEEYVIAGLNATDNCPFIYRKGSLMAVVGKGGDASNRGNGGNGGGIGIQGATGNGSGGGIGGSVILNGQLPSSGILGSFSSLTPISPDTKATGQNGGRTIPCTKGNYWIQKGFSACQDVGSEKFYRSDGTLISNTAQIQRGYKAGYDIRQTSGAGAPGTTTTQFVSKTCTRVIPKTCYTTVTQQVTKSALIVHGFGGPTIFSGDPFNVVARGDQRGCKSPGEVYYDVGVQNLGLSDYNYTIGIQQSTSSDRGEGLTDPTNSISLISNPTSLGYYFLVYFQMNRLPECGGPPGLQGTFCGQWRINLFGNQTIQQAYDCSTTELYDCSYTETIQLSGGGKGGDGATGGNGGNAGAGGGGGSGYSDGSVTVVSSQQGGSNSARIIIRSVG